MPKVLLSGLSALLMLLMLGFAYSEADAARIGGGRSFGSRPSMSMPYTKPAPSPSSPTMRQQAQQQQPGAAATAPQSRGLFGGMGGMLGGLLAGGLLGSLLFGGGMGAGFGGILDLLLIAVVAFLVIKFIARRRASSSMGPREAAQGAGHANATFDATPSNGSLHQRSATNTSGFDWNALTTPSAANQTLYNDTPKTPAGFDTDEFLRGAKAAYTRLNASWDKRDFQDIAQFTTPAFLSELRRQGIEDNQPGNTEIMLVNADLLEVSTLGNEEIAQVYFTVLLREDPSQESPVDVREVWHFVRPASGEGMWRLDGIQQVEN